VQGVEIGESDSGVAQIGSLDATFDGEATYSLEADHA
jgi:hypothetical protein